MASQSIVDQMLQKLGLLDESWTELNTLEDGIASILEDLDLLVSLNKGVVGNLTGLTSKEKRTRRVSVCGLARRLARNTGGAIIRKRKQVRVNNKTVSKYSYKYLK